MTERRTTSIENDPIYEAAAEWLVRLQDPHVSLEDTLAWQAWMKQDARHARAFARVEEVSQAVRDVRPPRERSSRELEEDDYDGTVALDSWRKRPAHPRPARLLALAASIALAVIGLVVWRSSSFRWHPHSGIVMSTAVGENRTVSLADGSTVVLGGNTSLAVALSRDTRSIALTRGEAFFTVAKDPSRPFEVNAGDATVIAVGTEFNVRRTGDRSFVSVVEGRVIVEPSSRLMPTFVLRELQPKLRPVPVDAGQQTTAGSAGIELASAIEDASAVTSWQSGRLAFRLQPLKYVLEDVNRYAPKPIVVADDSIAALVITGTVTSDNVSGWVSSLERGFDLTADEQPDRIVLKRR
jgi:transmembrane sensor